MKTFKIILAILIVCMLFSISQGVSIKVKSETYWIPQTQSERPDKLVESVTQETRIFIFLDGYMPVWFGVVKITSHSEPNILPIYNKEKRAK